MKKAGILAWIGIAAAIALVAAAMAPAIGDESGRLSVEEAYAKSLSGEVLLVDIRSREEWSETGVATTARLISMHEPGFLEALNAAVESNRDRAIALICATGSRSALLQGQLARGGFSRVFDVPAGMLGQKDKPGWIASGLPLRAADERPQ